MEKELPKLTESYHAPFRIAVMREDKSEIKRLFTLDPRLLHAFEDLAMTIAVYHNKKVSIELLKILDNIAE